MEDEALLACVNMADRMVSYGPIVDGCVRDDYPYDGMASAGVGWSPYEHKWVAHASWSSGTRLMGEPDETVLAAIINLEARLLDELLCLKRGEERKKKVPQTA